VAFAWAETLDMLYKLYEYSYGTSLASNFSFLETGPDEINQTQELEEEETNEDGGHPGLSEGDGIPNPEMIYQCLHDKVRSILMNPLLATDVKKHNLRIYCKTLWQHMWSYESIPGIGDDFTSQNDIFGLEELGVLGVSNNSNNN
jgi:hypothetical protein